MINDILSIFLPNSLRMNYLKKIKQIYQVLKMLTKFSFREA